MATCSMLLQLLWAALHRAICAAGAWPEGDCARPQYKRMFVPGVEAKSEGSQQPFGGHTSRASEPTITMEAEAADDPLITGRLRRHFDDRSAHDPTALVQVV